MQMLYQGFKQVTKRNSDFKLRSPSSRLTEWGGRGPERIMKLDLLCSFLIPLGSEYTTPWHAKYEFRQGNWIFQKYELHFHWMTRTTRDILIMQMQTLHSNWDIQTFSAGILSSCSSKRDKPFSFTLFSYCHVIFSSHSTHFTSSIPSYLYGKLFNIITHLSQECPSGMVTEDMFKEIFARFFPQGGESEKFNTLQASGWLFLPETVDYLPPCFLSRRIEGGRVDIFIYSIHCILTWRRKA